MATLRIGDTAPNFTQESSTGTIDFYDWAGDSWVVLFSHPADFTPVCTTELGRTAALSGEFARRNVKPIAISVDPVDKHREWIADIDETQSTTVDFPILADPDRRIAELYDLIHPNASTTATVRTVYWIDPQHKIRATLTYPASTGRNFDELLRVIDSLQLTAGQGLATPVDWTKGDRVIVTPAVSDEDAKERFDNFEAQRPYLRYVDDPTA